MIVILRAVLFWVALSSCIIASRVMPREKLIPYYVYVFVVAVLCLAVTAGL